MQLLLKFSMADILQGFITKSCSPAWQNKDQYQHFGVQSYLELMLISSSFVTSNRKKVVYMYTSTIALCGPMS